MRSRITLSELFEADSSSEGNSLQWFKARRYANAVRSLQSESDVLFKWLLIGLYIVRSAKVRTRPLTPLSCSNVGQQHARPIGKNYVRTTRIGVCRRLLLNGLPSSICPFEVYTMWFETFMKARAFFKANDG